MVNTLTTIDLGSIRTLTQIQVDLGSTRTLTQITIYDMWPTANQRWTASTLK